MKRGKVLLFDWDFITARDDSDVSIGVCLTYAERLMLLTIVDFIGWASRWQSPAGETIIQDDIDAWRDSISNKLMLQDCTMDCDDVLQCIIDDLDGDGDLTQALIDWLNNNVNQVNPGGDATNTAMIEAIGDDLASGLSCSKDDLYGFTTQLVQLLNMAIEDFFEIVEQLTSFIEYAGAIVDNIPYLSQITDFVDYLCENIADNYLAHYDLDYEIELACELLCLAYTENCVLTWEMLLDVMSNRVAVAWVNAEPGDFFDVFVTGTWEDEQYVDLAIYACAFILGKGAGWGGYTLERVRSLCEGFLNDPDSDWATDCDCGWIKVYKFDEDELGGWTINQGIWANSWALYSQIEGGINEAGIEHDYTGFDGLEKIKVLRRWDTVVEAGQGLQISVTHDGGSSVTSSPMGAGAVNWITKEYDPPLDGVTYIELQMRHNNTDDGGSVAIEKIRMEGTGNDGPDS